MVRIIVTAPGSLGDVNPLLSIARRLTAASHQVTFFAAERYLPLVRAAGLDGRLLVTEEQFQRWTADPRLWHPWHGTRLVLREAAADYMERHFYWLKQNCDPNETVLISHMLDFAGRVYRDLHPSLRLVSVLPAPVMLRSRLAPPRLSGYRAERMWPRALMPLAYRLIDRGIDWFAMPQINKLRRENGLPAARNLLRNWWWSPDRTLALFPEWFSIPAVELPPKVSLTGFPLADSHDLVESDAEAQLGDVLQEIDGRGAIVFAPGTAHHHAATFLNSADEVCRRLGKVAILISTDPSQFPAQSPHAIHRRYVPFSRLLPHCEAIVHHGGIGTTSQALRAGVPQVVAPMAFDQFDNAARVAKLGCGSVLPMRRIDVPRLERALRGLAEMAPGAAAVRERIALEPSFSQRLARALDGIVSV